MIFLYLLIIALYIAVPLYKWHKSNKPLKNSNAKRLLVWEFIIALVVGFVLLMSASDGSGAVAVVSYIIMIPVLLICCFLIYPKITKDNKEENDGMRFFGGCLVRFLIYVVALVVGAILVNKLNNIPLLYTAWGIGMILLTCNICAKYIRK